MDKDNIQLMAVKQIDSIYNIKVSELVGAEYVGMFNDMARFMIIQISIQFLLMTIDPNAYSILSGDFIVLLMFIVVGVMCYWLLFRKIVSFS
jgi:hypothetical protein